MLNDRRMRIVDEDGTRVVRPRWTTLADEVVENVRLAFGDAIAHELAGVLAQRTTEAEDALAASFAATEQRLDDMTGALADVDNRIVGLLADAAAIRENATTLEDAAACDRDVAAALRQKTEEVHRSASEAHTSLDAREAELIAWEAELSDRARRLGERTADATEEPTPAPSEHPQDDAAYERQFRLLRSQWSAARASATAVDAPRGWGRRRRSDDPSEPEAR